MFLGLFELDQQLLRIPVVVPDGMGVLEIQVVVTGLDLIEAHRPRLLGLLSVLSLGTAPPVHAALQVFDPNGLGH